MSARRKTPRGSAALLALALAAPLVACGDDDFKNEPRPPVAVGLTGVIQSDKVTVSPARIGAGPVELTIANQTDEPHPIIITGGSRETRVAAVPPTAAATIQRTLEPGEYEIRAGSEAAVEREIKPAILTVGPERESASGELSLP